MCESAKFNCLFGQGCCLPFGRPFLTILHAKLLCWTCRRCNAHGSSVLEERGIRNAQTCGDNRQQKRFASLHPWPSFNTRAHTHARTRLSLRNRSHTKPTDYVPLWTSSARQTKLKCSSILSQTIILKNPLKAYPTYT